MANVVLNASMVGGMYYAGNRTKGKSNLKEEPNIKKETDPHSNLKEDFPNLNQQLDGWGETTKTRFLQDFRTQSLKGFKDNPDLVKRWKELDDLTLAGDSAFTPLKKDIDFLRRFDEIAKDVHLNEHIFKGHVKQKSKLDGTEYWEAGGVHSDKAITDGHADYRGTQTPVGPPGLGYFKSKVKIYDPSFPQNGGWKSKSKASTFFPNSWGPAKVQAEVALVLKNNPSPIQVTADGRKLYGGTMSDGVQLRVWTASDGKFESAFPLL